MVDTELITADPVLASALIGTAAPDQLPAEVVPRLVLVAEPGRTLNERNVADLIGLNAVAAVPSRPVSLARSTPASS